MGFLTQRLFLLFLLSAPALTIHAQSLMFYSSESFKFTVQVPEDWKREDKIASKNVALVMVSPEDASLSITFHDLNSQTSEQFIDRYESSLSKSLEGIQVLEKGSLKSRDDEATYLIYEYVKDSKKIKEKVCFYSREGEICMITINMEAEKFHLSLPTFDQIFASFTFETDQEKIEGQD